MTMLMWRSLPSATIVACLKSIVSRAGEPENGGAPESKIQPPPVKRPPAGQRPLSAD
jgi:hypothetical protein